MVHLLRGLDHERVVARGLGVAVGEHHLFVVPHDMVDAETLGLRVVELLAQRHEHSAHLLAEGRDLFLAVIRTSLLKIAEGDVVLVTEVLAHLVADTDQFRPYLLQTRLVVLIELGVCLDGGGTHCAVGMLEVFLYAVEIQRFAVEGYLGSRHDLLILVGQAALLLTKGNVGLAEHLLLNIHGDKILLVELAFNVRAEGAGRNSLAESDRVTADRGHCVLKIVDLRFVELVARVKRVADMRDGILREQLAVFEVDLGDQLAQRGIALSVLDRGFPLDELRAVRLQIGALVLKS